MLPAFAVDGVARSGDAVGCAMSISPGCAMSALPPSSLWQPLPPARSATNRTKRLYMSVPSSVIDDRVYGTLIVCVAAPTVHVAVPAPSKYVRHTGPSSRYTGSIVVGSTNTDAVPVNAPHWQTVPNT